MDGLTDKQQTILVMLSTGSMAASTYIATSAIPDNIKGPVVAAGFVLGILGFGIKEALGGQAPATAKPP